MNDIASDFVIAAVLCSTDGQAAMRARNKPLFRALVVREVARAHRLRGDFAIADRLDRAADMLLDGTSADLVIELNTQFLNRNRGMI